MNLHFSKVLQAGQVDLRMDVATCAEAVDHLLGLLRGDSRIPSSEVFEKAVRIRGTPTILSNRFGLCIAHGRTDSLSTLVMAAARPVHPLPISSEDGEGQLRLVFVAGIPSALNTEYLRLVGAIARICADPESVDHLLSVKEPARFVEILECGLNQM
jgi:mannitol/fructose-specific phosphotransferase system IIA component (Ntr-type)